jgi:Na+/proline symporter
MFGLHLTDVTVIVVYLIGITAIGIWTARKVHNMADFIMPRRFGKAMMMMHAFGTGTHSDQAVSVASKSFTSGISGIWYQWLWLFTSPFYWVIPVVMRRFRALTTADVFELRFDRSVAMLFAIVGMVNLSFNMGVMLKGSGAVITAASGGHVPANTAILIMTALFLVYGVAGGLAAAIVTDFIQGLLTIVFSFLLLPYLLSAVGGLAGAYKQIGDPQMFSLVVPGDIGVFYIGMLAFNALVGIVAQPHFMSNVGATRKEFDSRFGQMSGSLVKRICTMAWAVTGLVAVAYYAQSAVHPDEVYGHVARDFLPQIMPGLLGVFLASLLASVMSSCDSFMIASSALFAENLYKPLRPGRSQQHYLWVTRLAAAAVVAGGVFSAYRLENVIQGLEIFWKITPMMGIAFWLGLFWRRATVAGAWAATLSGFGAWWLTTHGWFIEWIAGLPGGARLLAEKGSGEAASLMLSLPWQMVFYLVIATLAGILVSLVTRPVAEEKLKRFQDLAWTPVRTGEIVEEPCTLPAGTPPVERRWLVDRWGLRLPIPSRTSVIGFAIGWVIVGVIIGGFALLMRVAVR